MKPICADCKEECKVVLEDFGIGPYEYWGAKGTHHDYQAVSDCCECGEVLDEDGGVHDAEEYYEPEEEF